MIIPKKLFTVRVAIALLLFLGCLASPAVCTEPAPASGDRAAPPGDQTVKNAPTPSFQDYALFIAGLKGRQNPLSAEEAKPVWANHAKVINQSWANYNKRQLAVMREWAGKELSGMEVRNVFYPFSGPDFVNMFALFPKAPNYLMLSLEPVGDLPDIAAGEGNSFFPRLQRSLYDLLHLTFFITPKLEASLGNKELSGVLPVLLFFMAREGLIVEDVKYWVMKADGSIEETEASPVPVKVGPGDISGLRLVFKRPGAGSPQTLYYFRFNIANENFEKNKPFLSFLEKFAPFTSFSKAASYLMYRPRYSNIRDFIMNHSQYVVQSDSVIPLQYFDKDTWDLRFYGAYSSPIALFSSRYQKDLAAVYQKGQDIKPLPFGFCYRYRPRTSNLMFASQKASLEENQAK